MVAPSPRAIETGSSIDTTSPGNAPWSYVGSVNGCSGVYLGNYNGTYWVLTAAHVGAGDFTLNGVTYHWVSGSALSIYNTNNTQTDGTTATQADLTLFQISGDPGLPNLTIPTSAPYGGATVEMIGFGGGKSWGDNTIFAYAGYSLQVYSYGGAGIITLASGEGGNGAQGTSGDSGGGMFYQASGETVELVGTLSGVGDVDGGGTDYGQGTVAVDLAVYSSQITADIQSVAAAGSSDTPAMPPWAMAGFGIGLLLVGFRFLPREPYRMG